MWRVESGGLDISLRQVRRWGRWDAAWLNNVTTTPPLVRAKSSGIQAPSPSLFPFWNYSAVPLLRAGAPARFRFCMHVPEGGAAGQRRGQAGAWGQQASSQPEGGSSPWQRGIRQQLSSPTLPEPIRSTPGEAQVNRVCGKAGWGDCSPGNPTCTVAAPFSGRTCRCMCGMVGMHTFSKPKALKRDSINHPDKAGGEVGAAPLGGAPWAASSKASQRRGEGDPPQVLLRPPLGLAQMGQEKLLLGA